MFAQILAITAMNLRNVGTRLGTSSVIVAGIGGVVAVLVAILSLANGFSEALLTAAHPDRAILMRGSATSEMNGAVTREQAAIVRTLPGVQIASEEVYAVVDVPKKDTGTAANLILRGAPMAAFEVRPEVGILEGRRFEPGRQELIVGRGAHEIFDGVEVGDVVPVRGGRWTVVGVFEADGSAYESEIWGEFEAVNSAMGRGGVASTMRLKLDDPSRAAELGALIEADPRFDHVLRTETEYYARQTESLDTIISGFGYVVATIMAIGAVFAALNTMYSAVGQRTREIATLRALGFGGTPVVISVMVESLALAVLGALLGAALVFVTLDGYTSSTLNNASFSQITFDYTVNGEMVVQGLVWALTLGTLGGLFPALRAARQPITTALRGE